jgi:RNA polymerase sigma-70 factor (ECF subfamily)
MPLFAGGTMNTRTDTKLGSVNERERALLRRVALEDRAALSDLYRIYQPRLFKFVFRLTHSYSAADELANDIMLIVWRKAATFRGDSKVSTWIFGIAYRQTMRRVSRKTLPVSSNTNIDSLATSNEGEIEREDWVRQGLLDLPPVQQLTVLLVFYLGLSYEEAAEVSECPVNTVKTRMFHARKKLRKLLSASAAPESDPAEV